MTKRTDPHRPTAINPDDYWYLASYAYTSQLEDLEINREHRAAVQRHIEEHGKGFAKNPSAGGCYCCGQFHNVGATFIYRPTMELVKFGHTCADGIDMGNAPARKDLIRTAKEALERKAGKGKAEALLNEIYDLAGVWEWAESYQTKWDKPDSLDRKGNTLKDMVEGLIRRGGWSEAQISFAGSLWESVSKAEETRAQWAEERAQKDAVAIMPEAGRQVVTGKIVSLKVYESEWGDTTKMLVDCGTFRVFCSVPGAIHADCKPGVELTFTVTLEPKERGFAIGKRPAKAALVA